MSWIETYMMSQMEPKNMSRIGNGELNVVSGSWTKL